MTTEERLAKVERELAETKAQAIRAKRRSRWLLVGLALGVGALALVWASAASAPRAEAQGAVGGRTVRAERFELVDAQGEVRAVLSVEAGGPSLVMTSAAGKGEARLAAGGDGAGLVLLDENGRMGAALNAVRGEHGLLLLDAAGKFRAMLTVIRDESALMLSDENGKKRAELSVTKGGSGVHVFDENGKTRAGLAVIGDGPMLEVLDENGKLRAKMGATLFVAPDGRRTIYPESSLLLFGPDGKVIWEAGGADGVATTPRQATPLVKAAPPDAPPPGSSICPDCKGTGRLITPSGSKIGGCKSCNGTGKIAPQSAPAIAPQSAPAIAPQSAPPGLGICPGCNGSGMESGGFVCSFCKGKGHDGTVACNFCGGRGFPKCATCGGTGRAP